MKEKARMLLGIDTATQMASVALYDLSRGWVLGEESWYSANRHTVELMPRLDRLLGQQGVAPAALTGLVVSLGPGSFTGLRIGLSVAKGLALALHVPIVGIPTLDVVAQPHMIQPLPIWAILQAGRGRICAAQYARRKGRWERLGETMLTTLAELCKQVKEPSLFCGEIDAPAVDEIRHRLGLEAIIATPAASVRRAAYLAELGWERLSRGDADDASSLSPIYLRSPDIHA
jgi:tRNA threonylcarbamoyladenosine biosynthesis protein TsaB